jgi:hypothetical protein
MDAMDCLCDVDFISKTREHFVGLSGKYIYLDGSEMQKGEDKNFCYSAFVIEIRGVWCLVTAGHVIEKIRVLSGIAQSQRHSAPASRSVGGLHTT